jgi:hypothetical protein
LDDAEVNFPFHGLCQLRDPESGEEIKVDGDGFRAEYRQQLDAFRDRLNQQSKKSGIDYVPLDTSMQFDKALMEYLLNRKSRF